MESGTLLHIALLRKTSIANKRRKSTQCHPKKLLSLLQPVQLQQQNFTLTGWSTEQERIRQPACLAIARNIRTLRQSYEHDHKDLLTQRPNVKTSQCGHRTRNRSHSFRKYNDDRACNEDKWIADMAQRLKQFNSQTSMRAGMKFSNLRIPQETDAYKENSSAPQFMIPKIKQKIGGQKDQNQLNPRSSTNFMNLNSLRGRKYFQL